MSTRRIFTEEELSVARAMRADGAGWYSIGRAFGCHEDTIHRALDPQYEKARAARESALKAARNAKARAEKKAREEREGAATQAAWKPSRLIPLSQMTRTRPVTVFGRGAKS